MRRNLLLIGLVFISFFIGCEIDPADPVDPTPGGGETEIKEDSLSSFALMDSYSSGTFIVGQPIDGSLFQASYTTKEGESATVKPLPNDNPLLIKVGADTANLREVTLGTTPFAEGDKIVSASFGEDTLTIDITTVLPSDSMVNLALKDINLYPKQDSTTPSSYLGFYSFVFYGTNNTGYKIFLIANTGTVNPNVTLFVSTNSNNDAALTTEATYKEYAAEASVVTDFTSYLEAAKTAGVNKYHKYKFSYRIGETTLTSPEVNLIFRKKSIFLNK